MKINKWLFFGILLLSILSSFSLALSAPLKTDELEAIRNIYLPVITGFVSVVMLTAGVLMFKSKLLKILTLAIAVILNLFTGLFLKITFTPSFIYRSDKSHDTCSHQQSNTWVQSLKDSICVQNSDGFPDDNHLALSKIYHPKGSMSASKLKNLNHDKAVLRITNNSSKNLVITKASFSDDALWQFVAADPKDRSKLLPLKVPAGKSAEMAILFTGKKIAGKIDTRLWRALLKLQYNMIGAGKAVGYQLPVAATTLKINGALHLYTDDSNKPIKTIYINSLWQYRIESDWEPDLQKQLNVLGFSTNVNFRNFDHGVKGEYVMPSSDEIACRYLKVANAVLPVSIRKLAAYHGCCAIEDADDLAYYYTGEQVCRTLLKYSSQSGQTLLPAPENEKTNVANFHPLKDFGFKIGSSYLDRTKNYRHKIGIRVWKAINANGQVLPHTYIIGSDYLGTKGTNYDYQDNVYLVSNVVPNN